MHKDDDGLLFDAVEIVRWIDNKKVKKSDFVIKEADVLVKIDNKGYQRFSCSPSHFEYLAAGIFITKGLDPSLIKQVDVSKNGRLYTVNISTDDPNLNLFSLNSSDHYNKEYTQQIGFRKNIDSKLIIPKDLVPDLVTKLDDNSFSFKETGGTHVIGIYYNKNNKKVFTAVEDISRHSAIDKAIGMSFFRGIDPSSSIIVISCRQTESIINKIIMGGFPIIIGLSAPTDAAIHLAREFNVTLIGFASKDRFNIYANDWRILF